MKNFIFGVISTIAVAYLGCVMYEQGRFDVATKLGGWCK